MADIRITSGTAWLGFSGFGVQLKVFGQAPGSSAVLLGYTSSDQPANGELGNGAFLGTPWYLTTNGVGTYKVWAEHPDNPGTRSNEATYYFDPDNYEGSGDPFDWNGDGVVSSELVVPSFRFTVYGSIESAEEADWLHCVVATSAACSSTATNIKVCFDPPDCLEGGTTFTFVCRFSFRANIGETTFYVYARDHKCPADGGLQSNVVMLQNVSGSDEYYNVGTLEM